MSCETDCSIGMMHPDCNATNKVVTNSDLREIVKMARNRIKSSISSKTAHVFRM
ncbi:hypothetical protein EVA_22291 [gut metagenome]|uniref:Uncharacterized protein n=1 Tax=gut metagenome TaxID=749906 RepID=J9F3Y6_9ZZZZ